MVRKEAIFGQSKVVSVKSRFIPPHCPQDGSGAAATRRKGW